jgi:predicted ArsR family transcriptional regulator
MTFNYEESGDGYLATLSYTKQKTTQETENKISTKEKILQLMTENNNITPIALASHIGVSENVIKQQLATLKKKVFCREKEVQKLGIGR